MLVKYLMINSQDSTVIHFCRNLDLHKNYLFSSFLFILKVQFLYYLPSILFSQYGLQNIVFNFQVIISVNLKTDCVNQYQS